ISDLIPMERRGEAMGLLGTAGAIGMAAGPAVGGLLANRFGLEVMFYCSSACALIAASITLSLNETLAGRQRFSIHHLKISRNDLFEPRVWVPCLIMALTVYSFGAIFTVLPDFGEFVGIRNKGL